MNLNETLKAKIKEVSKLHSEMIYKRNGNLWSAIEILSTFLMLFSSFVCISIFGYSFLSFAISLIFLFLCIGVKLHLESKKVDNEKMEKIRKIQNEILILIKNPEYKGWIKFKNEIRLFLLSAQLTENPTN